MVVHASAAGPLRLNSERDFFVWCNFPDRAPFHGPICRPALKQSGEGSLIAVARRFRDASPTCTSDCGHLPGPRPLTKSATFTAGCHSLTRAYVCPSARTLLKFDEVARSISPEFGNTCRSPLESCLTRRRFTMRAGLNQRTCVGFHVDLEVDYVATPWRSINPSNWMSLETLVGKS
jgi:hypothetical protein